MMRRVRTCAVGATVLAILLCANRTEADPIVITGGSVTQSDGIDLPGFSITGSDSVFTGILLASGAVCCVFNPGDLVTLNASFAVGTLAFQPTMQIVNGTAYPKTFLRGLLTFTAVPFAAPTVADGASSFAFATSFDMTGRLSGFSDLAATASPLFSVPIAGSGTATVDGRVLTGRPTFIGERVRFEFQPPAPTPEPASIVLLGTALLAGLRAATRAGDR